MKRNKILSLSIILVVLSGIYNSEIVGVRGSIIVSETVHIDPFSYEYWNFTLKEGEHKITITINCPYGDITLCIMESSNFTRFENQESWWGWWEEEVIEITKILTLTEGTWYVVLDNRESLSSSRVEISVIENIPASSDTFITIVVLFGFVAILVVAIIVISKRLKKSTDQSTAEEKII
ncbi:MAG: hypothetical protein ACXAC8_19390 [Candidatus Hodarchaeales archaeon]|jgi:hypothetical protein